MKKLTRFIPLVVIGALVVAFALVVFNGGKDDKTLTAYFPRTVSVFEGSEVRVLGVPVGKVESVTPEGTRVKVVLNYDPETKLPSSAKAVIVSPSIVADRYVQLTPAYSGGDTLEDDAVLQESNTAVPLELDNVYQSLDDLSVALGPQGANSRGALTDLLEQTARNFSGQGRKFHQTIEDFGKLTQTLDDNKEELFGSTAKLQRFITTLAENDGVVRRFNTSLGRVSQTLAGERQELAATLKNLGTALTVVGRFVRSNRSILKEDISGLNRVAKVLVRQRGNLDKALQVAPLALNNLQLTYNPEAGTLDTNANAGMLAQRILENPTGFLCALVSANDDGQQICKALQQIPLPRTLPFGPDTGSATDPFDPTLGGLVEAQR